MKLDHPEIAKALDRQLLQLMEKQRLRNLELYEGHERGAGLTTAAARRLAAELAKLGYTDDGEAPSPPSSPTDDDR
ncbi:MAG: hypothetical protein EXS13_13025 [Planctomycetes bacterium]|nr:hypothetical protein [Planctomycetota bacterium]